MITIPKRMQMKVESRRKLSFLSFFLTMYLLDFFLALREEYF